MLKRSQTIKKMCLFLEALVISIGFSSTISQADTAQPQTASAVTGYATITHSQSESDSQTVEINSLTRNDGVYSAPALTSDASQQPLFYAKDLPGKLYKVLEIDTTSRPNTNITYSYAEISRDGQTYWIDNRALSSVDTNTVIGVQQVSFQLTLGSNRNDGLYTGVPLTTESSMSPVLSVNSLKGQTGTVSELDTVKRSNGLTYVYAKVLVNNQTYFVDSRSIFDQVESVVSNNGEAYVNQTSRSDNLYSDPALTDAQSMSPIESAGILDGQLVKTEKTVTTLRVSNNQTYSYTEISYNGATYWIDSRALYGAKITSQTNLSGYRSMIVQKKTGRNDGIYTAGPALTSQQTMTADRYATSLNGHVVYLLKSATTVRPNGNTYVYVQIRDGANIYWIDGNALASGFEYAGGLQYYKPSTHAYETNTTVTDRGNSYYIGNNGYIVGTNSKVETAINAGLSLVGQSSYLWGGGRTTYWVNQRRFDCSSFVYWCYKQAGITLGNQATVVTTSLAKQGTSVSWSNMKRGDVFLMDGVSHVGIYLGGGYFLHDSPNSPTGGVGVSNLNDIINTSNFLETWAQIQDNIIRRVA